MTTIHFPWSTIHAKCNENPSSYEPRKAIWEGKDEGRKYVEYFSTGPEYVATVQAARVPDQLASTMSLIIQPASLLLLLIAESCINQCTQQT